MEHLIGTLTGIGGLSGTLSGQGGLIGTLSQPDLIPIDPYTGDYTVTPRLDDQTLATRGLRMMDDVTVYEIPVVYTSNLHGGKTVVIG